MTQRRLAFVDLETTGGNAARDRVTEIGIVRMEDDRIVDEWSSLVNPGIPIPAEIQALTGITNEMVRQAPTFGVLVDEIAQRLDGWTFVAHSARFDYGFLKGEFRRLGRRFLADVLCTVRLSRRLDPGHARHGLDAVVERHGLGAADRHRALGDARLIARFYQRLRQSRTLEEVDAAVAHLLKRPALPPHVPESQLLQIPDEPGVYVFRGINGVPIYVGKARNLRERVFAHFYADSRDANDARLAAEVREVEVEETCGEFSALVREIELIRRCAPLYNVALRRRESACFIEAEPQRPGWRIRPIGQFDPRQATHLHGPFGSRQSARAALAALGKSHRLCDQAIGLWTGERACFSRQIGRCLGLCCGDESPAEHQQRLSEALRPMAFPHWPFSGAADFLERDPERGRERRLRFDHWCLVDPETNLPTPFDVDLYKLLRRTLARQPGAFLGDPRPSHGSTASLSEADPAPASAVDDQAAVRTSARPVPSIA